MSQLLLAALILGFALPAAAIDPPGKAPKTAPKGDDLPKLEDLKPPPMPALSVGKLQAAAKAALKKFDEGGYELEELLKIRLAPDEPAAEGKLAKAADKRHLHWLNRGRSFDLYVPKPFGPEAPNYEPYMKEARALRAFLRDADADREYMKHYRGEGKSGYESAEDLRARKRRLLAALADLSKD